MMWSLAGSYLSWLTPMTYMGASAEGAVMMTFLAPPLLRWTLACGAPLGVGLLQGVPAEMGASYRNQHLREGNETTLPTQQEPPRRREAERGSVRCKIPNRLSYNSCQAVVAEWLRRLTRNQMGSPAQVRILSTAIVLHVRTSCSTRAHVASLMGRER